MNSYEFRESGIRNSLSGSQYKARLDELNVLVKPLLDRTTNVLINFTDHSLQHSLGVENQYELILNQRYDLLSEDERFFLIAATLLHDIGMVGTKEELQKQDYEEWRRNAHQYFSKDLIIKEQLRLHLEFNEAKLIAEIAQAHRKVDLDALQEEIAYGVSGIVRPRLLAALLRFADELHITPGRTSGIATDVLNPDSYSMLHHRRHESVYGVARLSSNPNVIVISAVANDWVMESAMHKMVEEIRTKHQTVKPILLKYDIQVDDVTVQLDCDQVVTKEVISTLADQSATLSELEIELKHRDPKTIRKVLMELEVQRALSFDIDGGAYRLTESENSCRLAFNELKMTDRILRFIRSSYFRESIGPIFDGIAHRVYGHWVSGGDRDDRLLLVCNSPTVIDHLLNSQSMDPNFAQMDRSTVLDLLILNGYMQDVTKDPSFSKEDNIVFAMQNVNNALFKNLSSFLSLVQHLNPDKQSQGRMILETEIEKKKAELAEEASHSFTLSATAKRTDYEHSMFPSLFIASTSSGQPFRVYKDVTLKDLEVDGEQIETGSTQMIEFRPTLPEFPIIEAEYWGAVEDDSHNRTLTLKLNVDGSSSDEYPYIIRLKFYSQKIVNFTVHISPFAASGHWNRWYNALNKIRDLEYRRLYIRTNTGLHILTSGCPDIDMVPSKHEYDMIKWLTHLEAKSGENLVPPPTYVSRVAEVAKSLTDGWEDYDEVSRSSSLRELKELMKGPKTTLVSVQYILDEHQSVPMVFEHFSGWCRYKGFGLHPSSSMRHWWEETIKSQGPIKVDINVRGREPSEIFEGIRSLNREQGSGIINHVLKLTQIYFNAQDDLPPFLTNVQIEFCAPRESVQEVKIVIRSADPDLNTMNDLLIAKNYIDAIPYLEKFKTDPINLSYAYVMAHRYDDAIAVANTSIEQDIRTVAHMTKGLAYVGKGDYESARNAYELGIHVCDKPWYPVAKEHLESFVEVNNISQDERLDEVAALLSKEIAPLNLNQRCYCGKKKQLKKCHASPKNIFRHKIH